MSIEWSPVTQFWIYPKLKPSAVGPHHKYVVQPYSKKHLSKNTFHQPLSQACCILQMLKYITKLQEKDIDVAEEVAALFAGELNPVAPKAQKKVPVPEG